MRIVGGLHRGRRIVAPPGGAVRPTADRARQALFDMLEHGGFGPGGATPVPDAVVLDAFCGTGALAFEALSRGAAAASLLDTSGAAIEAARATAAALGETARTHIERRDAARPGPAPRPHDLVFLDPPYGSGLAAPALGALHGAGWIAPGALVVVETGARAEGFDPPAGFTTLRERRYGAARMTLLRAPA